MTTPAKLLYLEDDEIDRRAFLRLVREQKLPWDVRIAQTLAAARVILSDSRFDAIIADYHLPDGDSTELCDAIQGTPFILLTPTVEEEVALRTVARGANDYLPKAPDQSHLAALPITVDKALYRRRVMDAEPGITRELRLPATASTAVQALRQREHYLTELNRTLEGRILQHTAELQRGTANLRRLHAELTQAEQRERRRLAEMLHDGLQQLLVAASMKIKELRVLGRDKARKMLEQVDSLLSESIEASRSLTLELFPPVLHDRGLVTALEWLADWLQEKQKLNVEVRAAADAEPPSEDMKIFLFQAIRELLFNVSKHSGVHTAVVSLHRDPTELTVQVIDRGKGFEPSRLPALEHRTTFGLSNVQQRLQWMGGEVRVNSAPGRGTEITLKVPFAQESPSAGTTASTETPVTRRRKVPRGRRLRVLLADDHKIVRNGIALLLKGKPGVEVIGEADDGVMAVELARTLHPDVVLMDVSMPRLDGVEATRQILRERPDICVIGVSMHEEEEIAAALRRAGAVGYVSKTSAQDALLATIRQCCFRDPYPEK